MSPWRIIVSTAHIPLTHSAWQCVRINLLLEFLHDALACDCICWMSFFRLIYLTLEHLICMCSTHLPIIHWVYIAEIIFLLYAFNACSNAILQHRSSKHFSNVDRAARPAHISYCKAISHRVPDVYSLSLLELWLPYAP